MGEETKSEVFEGRILLVRELAFFVGRDACVTLSSGLKMRGRGKG